MGIEPKQTYGKPISGKSLTVAYTGTAGTTAAVTPDALCVRITSTTDCFIEIGLNPTAVANTGMYMVAYQPEYFEIPMNGKVSAIQVSTGGSIYVTPF